MNAEFNWWLLIVGLVIGAGLVWLVLADTRRHDADVEEGERAGEARWIAEAMAAEGRPIDDDEVLEVLRLHGEYLAAGPPDAALELEPEPESAESWREPGRPAAERPSGSSAVSRDVGNTGVPIGGERPVLDRAPMAHPIPRPDDGEAGAR